MKEQPNPHNLHTDHVMIPSELKYLIDAKIMNLKCRVFSGRSSHFQWTGIFVWYDPLPRSSFGLNHTQNLPGNLDPLLTLVPVGNNPTVAVENRRLTECEVTVKQQSEGDVQYDLLN